MKDFGDILKEWESKKKPKKKSMHEVLTTWLDTHMIEDKDRNIKKDEKRQDSYKNLKIDDRIDLHLLTKDEAINALNAFFEASIAKGYKKVLIIHGKGKHSKNEAVLKNMICQFLEKHPNAGRTGHAKNSEGGSGATWVILKNEHKG